MWRTAVLAAQLFPTPAQLAAVMVELAQIEHGQEVLEPSAGTGAIVDAVRLAMAEGRAGRCAITAAESIPHYRIVLPFKTVLEVAGAIPATFSK
jgi:phospholipid N-methyltransferase